MILTVGFIMHFDISRKILLSLLQHGIQLYNSTSTLTADFDAQNTKIKKGNVRPDVSQITIAQKLDQI